MNALNDTDASRFLRASLLANAIFSTLSGLSFCVAREAIAAFLAGVPAALVAGVGIQLLVFAAMLTWLAARPVIPVSLALGIVAADLLWVVGTVVVVFAELFSPGGTAWALILADVVLLLAVLQSIGVRRMARTRRPRSAALVAALVIPLLVTAHLLGFTRSEGAELRSASQASYEAVGIASPLDRQKPPNAFDLVRQSPPERGSLR